MKTLIVLAVVFCFASASIIKSKVELTADSLKGRITHGQPAVEGQFPYQVGVKIVTEDGREMWCGGALISSTWIVTAAHCTIEAARILIYFGSTELATAPVVHAVGWRSYFRHYDYEPMEMVNDIAIIKFPAVTFTNNIRPVKLPPRNGNYSSYVGTEAVATGWGRTEEAEGAVKNLNHVNLTVISNEECAKHFNKGMIKPSNLCVATISGKSTCHGDSGGPLVSIPDNVLIGVVSFGSSDCTDDKPAVFTRITSYLDFIHDTMDSNGYWESE